MGENGDGKGEESGYREWERSVAAWWTTVLDDPAFARGMGDAVAGRGSAIAAVQDQVDRTMEAWRLPSKRDLVRLSRIASLLEDRLVALEDQVAEVAGSLDRIEKEALKARIQAAETRVHLNEVLAFGSGLDERLAGLEAKIDRLVG